MINYVEIVKIVNLDPIKMVSGDDLRFRIEIIKDVAGKEFSAVLWRIENYRIQPTFPQNDGIVQSDLADEEILVRDSFTLDGEKSQDAESALKMALKTISEKFT